MRLQEIHSAMRPQGRAPGFAATIVLTLALSVGVATAVFCVIDAVILRPLPFAHPERIVDVQSNSISGYQQPASWPAFKDERAQATTFKALAGYIDYFKATVETPNAGSVAVDNVEGTDNLFQVFGVNPLLGRTFLPGEEEPGKNQAVVLSYGAWQRYFGGDRNILDRTVNVDGRTCTVVGVMPAGFRFPINMSDEIYTPLRRNLPWMDGRGNHWLQTVGRIKDGVSIAEAEADLSHVFDNLGRAYPDTDKGRTVQVLPLAQSIESHSRGPLWTLLGAVLAVLAIGCVNVAGLLMSRGVKREREMAVRTAVGAARIQLVRQLLLEAVVLAVLGAAGGVVVASLLLGCMRVFLLKALERGADIHMNWTVLAAAVGLAVLASLLSSLLPALRLSGVDPNRALKAGGSAGTGRGQHRLRSGFLVTQVALTMVLVTVAALLIRVLTVYRHTDLGFDPAHILATQIDLSPARYQGRNELSDFYRPLLERVAQMPGVRAAGVVSLLPIEMWGSNSDIHIAGQPPNPPNREMLAENRFVSTGYFSVFGIPLHRGRMLSPDLDRAGNPAPTVVVNDAFVKKFIPAGLDPTLQRIDDDSSEQKWTRIVGVVGNVRQDIYEQPLAERDWLIDELPAGQRGLIDNMSLVVRFDGSSAAIVPALRDAIHQVDSTVPFIVPKTMSDVVAETLVFERMESWLFGIFATLALVLALVGLYGLVSHEVELAARDTGVRMALGATRSRILGMTLVRVAWMLGAGVAAGLALTLAARKLIGVVIYFDAEKQAGEFALLALLLVAAGLLAALLPAARAASIDPMQALRNE